MYEPGQIPQGDEPASLSHGDYKGRSPLEHEVQEGLRKPSCRWPRRPK